MTDRERTNEINPNLAGLEDLQRLPGVGEVLARRIVAGRPYSSLDDMASLSGVGPSLLKRWAVMLSFSGAADEPLERDHVEQPPPLSPDTSRGPQSWLLWIAGFSLASVLLSISLTLALLLGINGTLNMGRHSELRQLQGEVRSLGQSVDELASSIDLLESRLSGLAGLPGRMDAAEADVDEARRQVESARAQVAGLEDRLARMEATMVQWEIRAERFEGFLDGLRSLLNDLEPMGGEAIP